MAASPRYGSPIMVKYGMYAGVPPSISIMKFSFGVTFAILHALLIF